MILAACATVEACAAEADRYADLAVTFTVLSIILWCVYVVTAVVRIALIVISSRPARRKQHCDRGMR